jgi:hypothetical protein
VRLHTEIIKPPRALWVPFELGRPLGVPNDPKFQKKVLLSALKLLEAQTGPVLEDFPEEAPAATDEITVLSCPVGFAQQEETLTETQEMCAALKREMDSMRPWYDLAVKKRGRTIVGVSGLGLEGIAEFMCSFLEGNLPESPLEDVSLPYALNLATDDLKAYYFEGITSQPGQESPSSKVVSRWFWKDTVAGKVLLAIKEVCKKSDDGLMKLVGSILIVPTDQANEGKGS